VRDQGCRQCQQLTCGDCGMHDGFYIDGIYHWADTGYTDPGPKQWPFKCPLCEGFGVLGYGLQCSACKGTGIVWGPPQ